MDNAENRIGILPNYNIKTNLKRSEEVKSIKDLIYETENNYSKHHQEVSEYYLTHYGLRWFEKVVSKNNGYIIIISPSQHGTSVFTGTDTDQHDANSEFIPAKAYYTESNVLLPLGYQWDDTTRFKSDIIHQPSLFGQKVITESIVFTSITLDSQLMKVEEEKSHAVKLVYGIITKEKPQYLHLTVEANFHIADVEILAKAIFYHVYLSYRQSANRLIYIVVDFGVQKTLISEFVRIFSVFYDKAEQNPYMTGVQIALASTRDSDDNNKEINFIIGGKDYDSAYATANVFLYYNSKSTAPFIPLLKYLTRENSFVSEEKEIKKTAVEIFPFDLFLKNGSGQSWFINKMNMLLDRDIRNKPYGCKISDIHIRISSRIHLNTFFEAELLFHNISIVYRFSYLIAVSIIQSINKSKDKFSDNILIIGYENYSAILIQQIAHWVKNAGISNGKVHIAIIATAETGQSEVVFSDSGKIPSGIDCFTVIPIGTTMSTFYKLHTAARRFFGESVRFHDNYAIVSVCDSFDENEIKKNPPVNKYWNSGSSKEKTISLQPETNDSEGICIHYILCAISKWYDLNTCELCKRNLPLIQVDRTATIPSAIFELSGSNRHFLPSTNNLHFFEPKYFYITGKLHETVLYSHLRKGNNHYQFYFKLQEFVHQAEEVISKWARTLKINNDAYNIVISPLSISNARFLKIVIDNVFSSSLRLIHIDINNTYKEDLRAKFSYISSDYAVIKQLNPKATINFYFIDDSIVTGQSINRARMFLKMLIDEAGLLLDSPVYFKKIFLLINRSSYDTVNTFVKDVEKDLYSFCNLYRLIIQTAIFVRDAQSKKSTSC